MFVLSEKDLLEISGGQQSQVIIACVAALAGGYVASNVMSYFESLSTVVGTVGSAVLAGGACTLVAPVVGTVVCGSAGAVAGYFCASTLANSAAFGLGALAAGIGTYSAITSTPFVLF